MSVSRPRREAPLYRHCMASKYDRFKLVTDFEPRGDQRRAIEELVQGLQRGDASQVLLGVTGSGKTFTMAQCIAELNRPALVMAHNKTLAAQLYQEFRRFFPGERGRVLRQLLRLLPARGLRPDDRLVYREGSDDQRRDRSHAAVRDALAVRTPRRHHRRQRVLYLRAGIPGGVLRDDVAARVRPADRSRADPAQAGRDPVRAQRRRLQSRRLPRPRRHRRGLSVVRGHRAADRAVRRRGRRTDLVRPADRHDDQASRQGGDLSEDPLRDLARQDEGGGREHQGGARLVSRATRVGRQGARGAPPPSADDVRPRDDPRDRLLPRDRELLAPPHRPPAGGAAADPARLSAARRADDHRREPSDRTAGAGHVLRRSLAQGSAGRVRLPAALGPRQPTAQFRGVGSAGPAAGLRVRDARARTSCTMRAGLWWSRSSGRPD